MLACPWMTGVAAGSKIGRLQIFFQAARGRVERLLEAACKPQLARPRQARRASRSGRSPPRTPRASTLRCTSTCPPASARASAASADYNQGIWATTGQIEALGWLAVALVIFTTWKPLNAIWGAYLFGMLYWLYQFLPSLLGITMASHITDLVQMLPYVVTIIVLIVVSMRKKKENQPPAHLGLAYFREER